MHTLLPPAPPAPTGAPLLVTESPARICSTVERSNELTRDHHHSYLHRCHKRGRPVVVNGAAPLPPVDGPHDIFRQGGGLLRPPVIAIARTRTRGERSIHPYSSLHMVYGASSSVCAVPTTASAYAYGPRVCGWVCGRNIKG